MNYQEFDAGAPACDWQDSQDSAVASAQIERDQREAALDAEFQAWTARMALATELEAAPF